MIYMYGNLSAVAIGRGPWRCLKNILFDFKNEPLRRFPESGGGGMRSEKCSNSAPRLIFLIKHTVSCVFFEK